MERQNDYDLISACRAWYKRFLYQRTSVPRGEAPGTSGFCGGVAGKIYITRVQRAPLVTDES